MKLSRLARCAPVALVLASSALTSACSILWPSRPEEVYSLVSVSGQPLPATVVTGTTTDGSVYELQAVSGELRLYGNGRLGWDRSFRDVRDGVPADTLNRGHYSGSYERTDSTLVIRFTNERGESDANNYVILQGGRGLRGGETLGGYFARVYEYRRD